MNENFQDLLAENTEVAIDSLLENEIIKEIPILGSSIKIIRGLQNLRDRAYLNKIKMFVEKVGHITYEQKKLLIAKSKKSEKSRSKLGDAIFTTIEQSDATVKIEYLAIVFEAFLNKDFDESDLRLLCHIIRNSFSDDLIYITESEIISLDLKHVVASGLAEAIYEPLKFDGNTEPRYKLSGSANQLKNAWKKYKHKKSMFDNTL
jgi:hypothetical protein